MRREIALRVAVGALYAVAMVVFLRLSREIDTSWAALGLAIGAFGLVALIHRSILRVYEHRHVPPRVPEQKP